jgi:CRISPR-associated protein Cmr2
MSEVTPPPSHCYTAITFAPVQGFIEKSRKLRDLYGSSYLLSLLAQSMCVQAEKKGHVIVSPALPNITQGMPNQLIVQGAVPKIEVEECFFKTWHTITDTCRKWVEEEVKGNWSYSWNREWSLWANHAWEFFHVIGEPGETITEVRQRLNERKRSRAWTGINWQGESSTLSGTDAVAWAELGKIAKPYEQAEPWIKGSDNKSPVERFYEELSLKLGESFIQETPDLDRQYRDKPQIFLDKSIEFGAAFIDPREELSIPELTKRLITHKAVVKKLIERTGKFSYLEDLEQQLEKDLNPQSFTDLNRLQHKQKHEQTSEPQYWTGWFQGDGDGASDYLKWLGEQGNAVEDKETTEFSTEMRRWGEALKVKEKECLPKGNGRIIYAGGDDFLGVLYNPKAQLEPKDNPKAQLEPKECLDWLTTFNSKIWNGLKLQGPEHPEQICEPNSNLKKITVSVGFVWVSPKVPQRDVLQHCREAEQAAKRNGKNRVAFRIVFSGGNYLEWICPWSVLESGLFEQYCDRNGVQSIFNNANWTHLYNDVATLESRHAFGARGDGQFEIARALFQVYFGEDNPLLDESNWWNQKNEYNRVDKAGILGDRENFEKNNVLDTQKVTKALNNWVINLAKVGFHLCSDT